jgi:antitoxin StbD
VLHCLPAPPMATVAAGEGMAVAVLNRNEPAFSCVPARAHEERMDLVDDLEPERLADARLAEGQPPVRVSLDALGAGLSSRGSAAMATADRGAPVIATGSSCVLPASASPTRCVTTSCWCWLWR